MNGLPLGRWEIPSPFPWECSGTGISKQSKIKRGGVRATVSTPWPSIIYSDKSKFSAPTKASVASKQGCSHRIVWRPNTTLARRQWSWERHCQYHSDSHLIYEELDTVHQAGPRPTEKAGKRRRSEMRKFSLARQSFCPHEPDPSSGTLPCWALPICSPEGSKVTLLPHLPAKLDVRVMPSSRLSLGSKSCNFTCFTMFACSTPKPFLTREVGNYWLLLKTNQNTTRQHRGTVVSRAVKLRKGKSFHVGIFSTACVWQGLSLSKPSLPTHTYKLPTNPREGALIPTRPETLPVLPNIYWVFKVCQEVF